MYKSSQYTSYPHCMDIGECTPIPTWCLTEVTAICVRLDAIHRVSRVPAQTGKGGSVQWRKIMFKIDCYLTLLHMQKHNHGSAIATDHDSQVMQYSIMPKQPSHMTLTSDLCTLTYIRVVVLLPALYIHSCAVYGAANDSYLLHKSFSCLKSGWHSFHNTKTILSRLLNPLHQCTVV